MNKFQSQLKEMGGCRDSVDWAFNHNSILGAWRSCSRGDWMLWLAARLRVENQQVVLAACSCARLALRYTSDVRARHSLDVTELWASGDHPVSLEDVRLAANAAYDPYNPYEPCAAAYVAFAVADAADAAVYSPFAAAYAVADAANAVYCALVDDASVDTDAAVVDIYDQCAKLVRTRIDENVIELLWNQSLQTVWPKASHTYMETKPMK